MSDGDVASDLALINRPSAVEIQNIEIWKVVLNLNTTVSRATLPLRPILSIQQTPWLRKTSSFANSTEYRKHINRVLKKGLGRLHINISSFFDTYFEDITTQLGV
ncbi:uncharacterized protein PADG_11777 [Paracoccidioides brasiliensis Pb18]|uniref:Uncharacterized protein n=1 Tax=Paracoccidioides brasiliensis (strain Pb18) TaxID=502780 RepID=A0A0A0HVC0_PARBD|nr:uncharacterized protein PADG_11777 [Paracoccidioides brasiliensis Pb18]KGM91991.1 hypothetical protein PADG_11777 [Paracoccidioides brasiliensis Pb18]